MNDLAKRILTARQAAKLTQGELGNRLGISGKAISQWENGRTEPTAENLRAMALATAFNSEWIATGKGVARPLTSSFDPDASDPVEPFDAEAPPAIDPDAHPRIPVRGIVEIDATAGMGEGQVLAHMYRRDGREIRTVDAIKPQAWLFPEWFLARMPPPEHLFAVLAEGDSMSPTIPSGAVVFVDTRRTRPSPEGIYAIRDRYGAIQIKRIRTFGQPIGRMLVVSDKDGQGESVSMDDYAIVGFMVGKMTLD